MSFFAPGTSPGIDPMLNPDNPFGLNFGPPAQAPAPAPMPAAPMPTQAASRASGPDPRQLFGNLTVLRPNEEGHSYGTQYGLPINSMGAAGVGRYDLVDGGTGTDFKAGDMVLTQGLQAPPPTEGGSWMFSGKSMIGGRGNSGDDHYEAPDQEQGQWTWQPSQQAAAPMQEEAPAPRQDITPPPEYDPNRMYEDDDYFLDLSRRSVEGMNRMPFVGPTSNRYGINTGQSGYADLPYDPLLMMEEFYPKKLQGFQDKIRDPLDGEQLEQNLMGGGRKREDSVGLVSFGR
jgi:hypothetical protein